ncbi:methylesterase 17-like isoform X2 [Hibiscus syriacus]|uniref:methylesterase 17-like isoform X2 n=1 Tax=Hibiscus syriacus TaxID=106335 RepID=UPI001921A7B9|nr:methylesterase 17-like isoform X2 [Hibiscus syriacus]
MGEEVRMTSMEEREIAADRKRTHFVLVHGIGGGAWCWYKIRCLMENCGYMVSCIDLKGSGNDRSDADSILSFDDYNQPLMDFMSALPDTDKVILVGQSAGGLSVTQATHKFPNKIRLAVYVAATMLKSGYLTDQDIKDDSTLAAMLLRPGPILALMSARFKEEDDSVEKVRRVYVRTMHDNVIKPDQQEAMIKKWPPSHVHVVDSDHSPFFSAPFSLFGILLKVAATSAGCN